MAKRGRPRKYKLTSQMIDYICNGLVSGRTMKAILQDDGMPPYATVNMWLRTDPQFRAAVDRAREDSSEWFADEMLALADQVTTKEQAAAARVKLQALMWLASRRNRRKFGEKIEVDQRTRLDVVPEAEIDRQIFELIKRVTLDDGTIELLRKAGFAGALGGKNTPQTTH